LAEGSVRPRRAATTAEELRQGFDADFGRITFTGGFEQGPRHGHGFVGASSDKPERLQANGRRRLEV
jgi:hypothetical protein